MRKIPWKAFSENNGIKFSYLSIESEKYSSKKISIFSKISTCF
jgi:hypothetical protein